MQNKELKNKTEEIENQNDTEELLNILLNKLVEISKISAYPMLLSVADLSSYLGLSTSASRELMADPNFPIVKHGSRVFAIRDKIPEYLELYEGRQLTGERRSKKRFIIWEDKGQKNILQA